MLDKQRIGTFVIGGIAGALAGILLAPRSGKELRGSITTRAGEARERGRETYFEAHERLQERITETRERPSGPGRSPGGLRATGGNAVEHGYAAPEPPELDVELPFGTPAEPPPHGTPREVPQDTPEPMGGPDPGELRRRILETRSRLRAHLEDPEDRNNE